MSLSFSLSLSVHPRVRPPRLVRLWLCKGSYFPIDICQFYSYLHTHTSSFSHWCTGAYVLHHSHSKSIYIEIPTSYILCPKRFKNNAKSFKYLLLTTPKSWLDLLVSKCYTSESATLGLPLEFHLKVIHVLYLYKSETSHWKLNRLIPIRRLYIDHQAELEAPK